MAKEKSFADKVKKTKEKQFSTVKYVESVISEKTGHYRFQERMLKVPVGMKLDDYLKQFQKKEAEAEDAEETPDS